MSAGERLDSWKEIAVYLNRDVRTVQRWEHAKGMPVHRLGAGKRVPIYALKTELDEWLNAQPSPRRRRIWPWALAVVVASIAGAALWKYPVGVRRQTQFRVMPLTTDPGIQRYPSLSPDGRQVAFVRIGATEDASGLFIKTVEEATAQRLTPGPAGAPSWSPDGNWIAFTRLGFVYRISPKGPTEQRLTPGRSVSWMPDGKSLVIADSGNPGELRSLYSFELATGKRDRLTIPPVESLGDVIGLMSPDGKNLGVIRSRPGFGRDIYVVPMANNSPAGPVWRLTHDSGMIEGFAWTAGSREIVYSTSLLGRRSLCRMAISPRAEPERIAGTDEASFPSLSAGRLAYQVSIFDRNIWTMQLPDAGHHPSPAVRIVDSTADDQGPQFSPDGNRLAFMSTRSSTAEIWVSDDGGRQPVQLTRLGTSCGVPRWSPDGSRIAFNGSVDGNMHIFVIGADGSGMRRLTRVSWNARPSWSHDGRWIYFRSIRCGSEQIWKMPSQGGDAIQITHGGAMEAFESPDGKLLYYAKSWREDGIWSVPVDGGQETAVLERVWPGFWGVTGRGIYYLAFNARRSESIPLMLFSFESRISSEAALLEKIQLTSDPSFTVTNDGRRIAWAQIDRSQSNLMLMTDFR